MTRPSTSSPPLFLLFLLLLLLQSLIPVSQASSSAVFIATWKGDFRTVDSLRVFINGAAVHDVLLHNDSHVSFLVPSDIVTDPAALAASHIDIFRGKDRIITIPLVVLKDVIRKIERVEFDKLVLEKEIQQTQQRIDDVIAHGDTQLLPDDVDATYDDDDVEYDDDEGDNEYYDDDEEEDVKTENDNNPESHPDPTKPPPETSSHDTMRNAPLSDSTLDTLLDTHPTAPSSAMLRLNSRVAELESHFLTSKKHTPSLLSELATLAATDDEPEEGTLAASTRAKVALASLLLSGRAGVMRDYSRAVRLLKDAAESTGHPDANALLAFLHATGLGVARHVGAAVLYWTLAAEGGSNFARMALAFRYFTGTDVEEDCDKASVYYRMAAEEVLRKMGKLRGDAGNGSGQGGGGEEDIYAPAPKSFAMGETRRLSDDITASVMTEKQEHVQYYRHTADRGDAMAQVVMGNVYYHGAFDMPRDENRARQLWEAAAAQGRADANAHLGFLELRLGNNVSAVRHLNKAAKKGDKLGMHGMGYVLYHGVGVSKDVASAARYFKGAAEKDHAEAMYNLGIMYWRGVGVKKNAQEAFQLFQTAAQLRHVQSHYNVAVMLQSGAVGGTRDCSEVVGHLKAVAQTGVWQTVLSDAFRKYVQGDYADAAYGYLQAAHAGVEVAQFNAAFVFEKGTLTNRDGFRLAPQHNTNKGSTERDTVVEHALELYAMSAAQSGHSESLVRLGDLAFEEAKDYARAAVAYEKAAKLRSAEAMFNLGWMHARGFGMNEDRFMAKRYFDQARDTSRDAIIPAVLAVFSLQYAGVYDVLDRVVQGMKVCRAVLEGGHGADAGVLEGAVVVALVGLLAVVVNARQRRMVRAEGEEGEEGEEEGERIG